MRLIGDLIHKFGRETSERIVKLHYDQYSTNIRTSWEGHLEEFCAAWNGAIAMIVGGFTTGERNKYEELNSEHQKEAFIIIRAFAGCAAHKGESSFPVARNSLADRLSVTPQGAGVIVNHLEASGTIHLVQAYIQHKKPAIYRWFCSIEIPSSSQKGDGGGLGEENLPFAFPLSSPLKVVNGA
jgi:hypothetical protein